MVAWMWALGDNSIQISGFDDGEMREVNKDRQ